MVILCFNLRLIAIQALKFMLTGAKMSRPVVPFATFTAVTTFFLLRQKFH